MCALKITSLLYWLVSILLIFGLGAIISAAVLRTMAKAWIVSDQLAPSDVVAVLGGGVDIRPPAAAAIFKRGLATQVLVGFSTFDHGRDANLNRAGLLEHGVPLNAIAEFTMHAHSTYGEARGILRWAKASGVRSIIIPVEIFQTRRVRWIFNRELGPADIRIMVQAIAPFSYSVDNWWRRSAGLLNFRNELVKFVYYRLRY
jgi:hypothetical protein